MSILIILLANIQKLSVIKEQKAAKVWNYPIIFAASPSKLLKHVR